MEIKDLYEAPVTKTLELSSEGIICLSGEFNGFGEEELW